MDGDVFAAKCKLYTNHKNNQAAEYKEFLAKCYSTDSQRPGHFNQYMWITWHPFSLTTWSELMTVPYIKECVLEERRRIFGTEDLAAAERELDSDLLAAIGDKLWIWILSEKQETLVITPENRGLVLANAIKEGSM